MRTTNTMIIGGGQAGLALSHCLTTLGRDHLVLERGRVAERWRSARWDSLHLLTPSWMNRLPGWPSTGDPDAFLSSGDFVNLLEKYAVSFDAPVLTGTTVTSLTTAPGTPSVDPQMEPSTGLGITA